MKTEYDPPMLKELCSQLQADNHEAWNTIRTFITKQYWYYRGAGVKREDIVVIVSAIFLDIKVIYADPSRENLPNIFDSFWIRATMKSISPVSFDIETTAIERAIQWKPSHSLKTHELIQKLVNINTVIQKLTK